MLALRLLFFFLAFASLDIVRAQTDVPPPIPNVIPPESAAPVEAVEEPMIHWEEMPEFPGGEAAMIKFLQENVHYPRPARRKGVEGTVHVRFVVGKDGTLSDIKVVRSVHPLLDEEAMRVITAMPPWKPGTQDGKVVRVTFNLPIRFALE